MHGDKKLPSNQSQQQNVQLHDNGLRAGSLIDQAVSRLSQEQANNLMTKAGEEGLRLEVKRAEMNIEYVTGRKVTEDHIDTFKMLDRGGRLTRHSVTTDVKTGAGNMRIESKSGAACFVATAAYGDANHPDVVFLRAYRDQVLTTSKKGIAFIDWYWRYGPKIAKVVGNFGFLRPIARLSIGSIVVVLRKFYRFGAV